MKLLGMQTTNLKLHLTLLLYYLLSQKGTKAPQAAGKIHTDFERGFVMAEVMKFDDFKEEGSEASCKVMYIFVCLFSSFREMGTFL